jgi:hypothetical protein
MSHQGKTSIYTIAASVARNLGLRDTNNHMMNFIEWAFEAEIKIGSKDTFSEITVELEIKNKKVKLPCDFYKLIDLKVGNSFYKPTNYTFRSDADTDGKSERYYVDDQFIHFSSNSDGTKVKIAYLGIQTDDEGYPLIETSHVDAVSSYIMWKHKSIDYYNQKLPQYIYRDLEKRWYWLCGQARGNDNMPAQHEMESVARMWNTLVPVITTNGFKNI